jgi:TetR/AcrR family transcriptional regulator
MNIEEKNKPNKKEDIIKAAAKIFSLKGKAGSRMKDIAKEAGVSSALLHYHYRKKDDLYYEVLKFYIIDKVKELKETTDEDDIGYAIRKPKEFLSMVVHRLNDYFKTHKYFTKLLIQEMSTDGKTLRRVMCEKKESLNLTRRKDILKRLMEEGIVKKIDPFQFRFTMSVLILSLYTYEPFIDIMTEKHNQDSEKFKKERLESIIEQLWLIIKK